MNKQPEALRLADVLEHFYMNIGKFDSYGAAAELRRLHEANQVMLEALKAIEPFINDATREGFNAAEKAHAAIAKGEQA